jgi:hypothetical protein
MSMTDTPPSNPAEDLEAELDAVRREYRQVAARIADLGFIHHGTVIHRHAASPDARDDTPGRSPYYQWTSKHAGKTVTRTLTEDEADLYREWIANDRELRSLITQLRAISERATRLILQKVK